MWKPLLSLSVTIFFISITFGQLKDLGPKLKDGTSLYDKLYREIRMNGKEIMDKECANGCFFLKFKIDSKGDITEIASNNGSWPILDTLVRLALVSTNGLWVKPKNSNSSANNKAYLLPVLYSTGHCRSGIESKSNTASEILATIPDIMDTIAVRANIQKDMIYNFLHMNDFENKSGKLPQPTTTASLECILLAPIYLTAPKL